MPDSLNTSLEELPQPLAMFQPLDQLTAETLPHARHQPTDQLTAEALPQAMALAAPERSAEDAYNYKVRKYRLRIVYALE
jgi:hypothetical protein